MKLQTYFSQAANEKKERNEKKKRNTTQCEEPQRGFKILSNATATTSMTIAAVVGR